MTYADLQLASWKVANGLLALGVGAGDRVLMVVGDEPAFPATFLAGLRIGAIPVPVSTMLRATEVAALVDDWAPGSWWHPAATSACSPGPAPPCGRPS